VNSLRMIIPRQRDRMGKSRMYETSRHAPIQSTRRKINAYFYSTLTSVPRRHRPIYLLRVIANWADTRIIPFIWTSSPYWFSRPRETVSDGAMMECGEIVVETRHKERGLAMFGTSYISPYLRFGYRQRPLASAKVL
jgi:hypothetical protein